MTGAAVLVETVTRFTDEIFAMLIAVIYLALAVGGIVDQFQKRVSVFKCVQVCSQLVC